jgi:hypothetical protein
VVVIGLPELLAGIVIDLVTARPWLRLAAVLPDDVAIETAALESNADVLLAMSHGAREDRAIMGALLERQPRLRAIALRDDGRSAVVYELQPRLTTYNDVSAARLVEATVERSDWSVLLDPSEGEDGWP